MAIKQLALNGRTYYIDQLEHSSARMALVVLLRNLGPGLGEAMVSSLGGGGMPGPKALGRAIQDVCLRLNVDDLATLSELFGSCTQVAVKGLKVELNAKAQEAHFKGATGEWLEWLAACVEHNFSDFLELLTRAAKSASVETASPKDAD